MSLAVKAALLESRTLPKNEGRVLLAIAAHTNRAGDAWPSVATIAEYAGCSERTVQRCIPKLIKLGKLIVTKVAGIVTRVYRLILGGGASQDGGCHLTIRLAKTRPVGASPKPRVCHPKVVKRI